ncbi:uncharacterized protein LOC113499841 isoform X2 [Trichoplusia ni]|uniref:Uncharacterized protein LOC113499841 isoform X2 n=1 Tax=Trichoplusia ni TaxID=7111 RepID=A0A7E5W6C7_TRINI|nr:uncharacterized protein LOC113499841 isoform X2 [Trichoplusia ni]
MNQVDQNINKDMFDSDLIDVESLDYSYYQTWLCTVPDDSGQNVDIVDWNLSCDWPINEDNDYQKMEKDLYSVLDNILKNEILSMPDKHKFDSRTYVKPKKRMQRPSIQNIVEVPSNPPSLTHNLLLNNLNQSGNQSANKYLTYNKYNNPLGQISPMLRLKTFNVDTNSENSTLIKEYAMKRRSLVQDDDPQLEDLDITLGPDLSSRSSLDQTPSKPINIDLSQPAHNLHNTFNKWMFHMYLSVAQYQRRWYGVTSPQNQALHCFRGLSNILNERPSLNMYQSGESLMRMSPPSLVSSLLMESSGTFNAESIDSRKSLTSHKDSGLPTSGRDSIDPMMTSMTLSILEEKDMSTSFLSQTTYPDNESIVDSLPSSLVSSVNSGYVLTNSSKPKDSTDSNIFSSATFTHLEQSEKLLSARPRCQLYNSFTKRDSAIRNSESYTKSREEACQIDPVKILNENSDKKDSPKTVPKPSPEMAETITLHYSNNRFMRDNDAEKENFETDDAFYKDMGLQKAEDLAARNSLNVTLGKQELNEIIQARQKLSLARKALPTEPEKPLPNQAETSPIKTIHLPNQTITVPRQSMENASELLSRRRVMNTNGFDRQEEPTRDTPKRSATFKKVSPKTSAMDATVVYLKSDENQIIDINSATLNLIDVGERTQQDVREWGSQERAMVGSSESTDTGTFSSSSPPDSVPETAPAHEPRPQVASTPLMSLRKGSKNELLNLHNTISPIYDMIDDKSYTLTKVPSANSSGMERTYDMHSTTIINSATLVKKSSVKRDIMAGKASPERKMVAPSVVPKSPLSRVSPTSAVSYGSMVPPTAVPRKSGLPSSKLRQYSSHRELSRIPGSAAPAAGARAAAGRSMVRRGVYASNPALSPTAPHPPPVVTDSYTIQTHQRQDDKQASKADLPPTPALVRQGTETLRRERPQSQLVAPRDPPPSRPYSLASAAPQRVARPASGPAPKQAPSVPVLEQPRPASGSEARASALPRPSRLPAPRRALRPPSVYSVAPTADVDHY